MKQNKRLFNSLLYTYNKSRRKLANLQSENRNHRRQAILATRIERLYEKLTELLQIIKRGTVIGAMATAALAFNAADANAQNPTFGPKQVNPFNLSVSYYSNPTPEFVDIDGDGDFDVFAHFGGYGGPYSPPNQFQYFENTGTNTAPNYAAPVSNPFGLVTSSPSPYMNNPTLTFDFVDIDGDGDFDLYAKDKNNSDFYYYQNNGSNMAPAFAAPITVNLGYGSAFETHPCFADIDGDGDFDLITGFSYFSQEFKYYENIGTASSPSFSNSISNPFGLTTTNFGEPTPEFVDLDGDGDFDLMSGAMQYNRGFVYFENTGSNTAPAYGPAQILPFSLTTNFFDDNTNPTMVDLDNDGNIDLLSGNQNGEFIYYKNLGACTNSSSTISPTAVCAYTSPSGNVFTTSNTYMDTIPNAGGCDSVITINLTINPMVNQTVSSNISTLCDSGSTTIDLASSQIGVNYYLRNDLNDTIISGPVAGTGSNISLNTGNITNTTTYNVLAKVPNNEALEFDGSNDKVDCGNDPSVQLSGTQITLEAWIYPTSWRGSVNDGNIINKEQNGPGSDFGYMIRCGNNGQINFNLGSGNWNDLNTSTGALVLNQWQHVAATYDGTTMSIYVNGNLVASQPRSISFSPGNSNLTIGNWSNSTSRSFPGKIDDVRIWSTSKTQSEIQTDMNSCLLGSESNLAAYYQFENRSGSSTLTDLSSNSNDGTLINMNTTTAWVDGVTLCASCDLEMTNTPTITVNNSAIGTDVQSACDSFTWSLNNVTYTSSTNTPTFNIVGGAANSCDSLVTLNLTILSSTPVQMNPFNQDTICDNTGLINLPASAPSGGTYSGTGVTGNMFDPSVAGAGTHTVYYSFTNGNNCTSMDSAMITVEACVGINESSMFSGVNVYPNPTNGLITINMGNNTKPFNYQITSIDGKIIEEQNNITINKVEVNLTNNSKGIYLLKLSSNNDVKLIKLIKN